MPLLPARFQRLRTRIIAAFAFLIVVVQAIAVVLVAVGGEGYEQTKLEHELQVGERIVRLLLDDLQAQLTGAATRAAADSRLWDALAASESARAESVLRAHGAGTEIALLQVLDARGRVLADGAVSPQRGRALPLARALETARRDGVAAAVMVLDGQAYLVAVVPLAGAPRLAAVIMGRRLDDALALEMQRLTDLAVSLLLLDAGGVARPLASSLPAAQRREIGLALATAATRTERLSLKLAQTRYEARLIARDAGDGERLLAVLARERDEGRFLTPVTISLSLLALLSLPLAVWMSYLVARSITQPLSQLASAAQRMQAGDYSVPIRVEREDELGLLASSLNHLREGIARREREILRLAYEDSLTGLPNRSLFMDRLQHGLRTATRRQEPLAVMVLDLDRFKEINDMLGHVAGDAVLKQVAARLQAVLRDTDTVARLGGDEFAVVLPAADAEMVRLVARRIALALREPVEFEGQPLDVAASIGSAIFPQHGEDAGTLIRHADLAMYVAKRNRAGHVCFDPSYDVGQREHLSLLSELRRAVEESQLRAYYQPQIDLVSGRVRGVEALVRWRHPTRGLLMPSEFLPYAEQTGFVRVITRWMLAITLRQCGRWAAAGLPLQVSVNISARDLMNRDFPHILRDLLQQHAVPPHLVCLEITESSFIEDPKHALATLNRLHDLGVRLAIDDFGTGFSSLAYLRKMPVTELKIERSFVRGMVEDKDDYAIVRSTIDLAHNLNLRVVAEGVETEACMAQLRALGCDTVQGYLISQPLRRRTLEEWLRESPWGFGADVPPPPLEADTSPPAARWPA